MLLLIKKCLCKRLEDVSIFKEYVQALANQCHSLNVFCVSKLSVQWVLSNCKLLLKLYVFRPSNFYHEETFFFNLITSGSLFFSNNVNKKTKTLRTRLILFLAFFCPGLFISGALNNKNTYPSKVFYANPILKSNMFFFWREGWRIL